MRSCRVRAGVGACRIQINKHRGMLRTRLFLAGMLAVATVVAAGPAAAQSPVNPVEILFLGNSFTHGRYDPALNYTPPRATPRTATSSVICCARR